MILYMDTKSKSLDRSQISRLKSKGSKPDTHTNSIFGFRFQKLNLYIDIKNYTLRLKPNKETMPETQD